MAKENNKWKTVGYQVPFSHLNHPDSWPAYEIRMKAYLLELGLDHHLLDPHGVYDCIERVLEENAFLVTLVLTTVSDDIAACLAQLGCTHDNLVRYTWGVLEALMDDNGDVSEDIMCCREQLRRKRELRCQGRCHHA